MKVVSAVFAGAASEPGRFPPPSYPEVAFAGRSNVGKSSALNRLLGRHNLARTSATPGRTQQLNFFLVNDRLVLVDLPGYGYARVSHSARAAWRPLVESYLSARGTLAGVVLLVDARRGLEQEEEGLLEFLAVVARPALVLATKIDKLNRRDRDRALARLATERVAVVPFSAVSGEGVDVLWRQIAAWSEAAAVARGPAGHGGGTTSPASARGPGGPGAAGRAAGPRRGR